MNAVTQCPELADPALSRIQAALDGTLSDVRKSNAWFAERDAYIRYALQGDPDWTTWDPEQSAQTLVAIQRALDLPADKCKSEVQRLIAARIQAAARGHADTCERNGQLYQVERNPNGSTLG